MLKKALLEFRVCGRTGQGMRTFVKLLGHACSLAGFHVQETCETTGPCHPAVGYVKASKERIQDKAPGAEPDYIIVLDHSLADFSGIKEKTGIVILNSPEKISMETLKKRGVKCFYVDANGIANTRLGRILPNTAMLGAIAKVFGKVSLKAAKRAVELGLSEKRPENILAVEDGFRLVKK